MFTMCIMLAIAEGQQHREKAENPEKKNSAEMFSLIQFKSNTLNSNAMADYYLRKTSVLATFYSVSSIFSHILSYGLY